MGIFALPTPPEGLGLKEYFEEWLPAQLENLSPVIKENAPDLKFAMGVRAEGDDGGEWTFAVEGGEIKSSAGLADTTVCLILAADELKNVLAGKRQLMPGMGGRGGGGGQPSPEKMAKRMTKMVDALKGVDGMIAFKTTGEENPDFEVKINFGPMHDEPNVSIVISESDMKAMQKGELNPQAAFMGGKIRIEGDMGFLMQLAPMMMG